LRKIGLNAVSGSSKELMMENKKDKVILVAGATGKQGGAVAHHLLNDGWSVRALTRDPLKYEAQALRDRGAKIVEGDLDNPATLDSAVAGVYGVFSVEQYFGKGVDVEIKEGMALADAAKKAKVSHFIYSSIGGAERKTGIPFFESKFQIENYVRKLNLKYTIIRPVYFMENFLNSDMLTHLRNGVLPMALDAEMSMQLLAVDDIGRLVSLAFDRPDAFMGKAIELAGDELTGPQMAAILGKAIGISITYKELPVESLHEFGADLEMLFDWMNRRGFAGDIEALQEIIPGLKTLEMWASSINWQAAAAA
jgi:uncharacterized protein YbjT (DUF2867 family)